MKTNSEALKANSEMLNVFIGQMIKSMETSISESMNKKFDEVSQRMTALEEAQE